MIRTPEGSGSSADDPELVDVVARSLWATRDYTNNSLAYYMTWSELTSSNSSIAKRRVHITRTRARAVLRALDDHVTISGED